MHQKQLDELNLTGALPSPTGVGLAILNLTQGDEFAMGDITRIIQSDPALTGRIIKLANNANVSASQPVTTVGQAAMRLGVRTVRNVALGFTLVSGNRSGACAGFDYEAYWSESLAIAVTAQAFAQQARGVPVADAFTCGLLCSIGTMALASIHSERYSSMLARARAEGAHDLVLLEREEFDLDHCELAGAMLRDWKLPESFAYTVSSYESRGSLSDAPDDTTRRMTVILRAASHFARHCVMNADASLNNVASDYRVASLLSDNGIDLPRLEQMRTECQAAWHEWCKTLQVTVTSAVRTEPPAARAPRPAAIVAPDEKIPALPERKGLRILAVDDDPVSLRLLEHHLTRDGHTVLKAANGRQALIMALESYPQMVVTDWMMPEMDGLDLCKALRRSNDARGIYLLLLTGREDEDRVVEAFDSGVDEYVVKPFNPKILLARVRAGQRMIELREQVERDAFARDRQVAEMAVLNRKLETAAMTDVLTRLPNRRFAMRQLEEAVTTARTTGAPLSVIMIDIDHFKQVNDQWGHDMGDLVLRETAGVLRNTTRKGDVVCRLGGEEFLVISAHSGLAQCETTAERIRAAIEDHIVGFGFDRTVTVSLGVASMECGPNTVDGLLKLADKRVYVAKAAGRNRVCASDAPPSSAKSA